MLLEALPFCDILKIQALKNILCLFYIHSVYNLSLSKQTPENWIEVVSANNVSLVALPSNKMFAIQCTVMEEILGDYNSLCYR